MIDDAAFREIEPLTELVEKQKQNNPEITPHVILVDGNGVLHERKAGLATFLGVRTGIPTIGVGKTIYCTDGLSVELVEHGVASKLAQFAKYCQVVSMISHENDDIVVICNDAIDPREKMHTEQNEDCEKQSMADLVQIIAQQCEGLAIPMKGSSGEVLAAALVGHGGKIAGRGKKHQSGTKIPIYISVGHDISLQEAIGLCAALSLARIPEPVRQADLIGRDIIKRQLKS